MSEKRVDILTLIRKFWFFVIIGVIFIIFLFNNVVAILIAIIFLIIFVLFYLPSLTFKSRVIRFMNKHSVIEDNTIAKQLVISENEIKELMHKLSKNQKWNKWLIVFLNNRYIFYHENTISRFKELYYKEYNEKQIFENLNQIVNIKTRSEIKAIENYLINNNRLEKELSIKNKLIILFYSIFV